MNDTAYKSKIMEELDEKKEFFATDLFRLIFAIGIVSIHVPPFTDINTNLNYFVEQILARLGVPFFFLVSGFFLQKKIYSFEKVKKYWFRILQLYLIYTLLYLPQTIYSYTQNNRLFQDNCLDYLKRFFLIGSYTQLWYFVALLVSVPLLYLFLNKLKFSNKKIVVIALILYAIGTIINAYIYPLRQDINVPLQTVDKQYLWLWFYIKIFHTTRNGLFFGFPYLFFGYLIADNAKRIYRKNYLILAGISFLLMIGEGYIVRNWFDCSVRDMLFTLLPTAIFVFLFILFIDYKNNPKNAKIAKHVRAVSTLCFGLHLFVHYYLSQILHKVLEIQLHSTLYFLLVLILTLVLAEIMIGTSNFKYFKWIKQFY